MWKQFLHFLHVTQAGSFDRGNQGGDVNARQKKSKILQEVIVDQGHDCIGRGAQSWLAQFFEVRFCLGLPKNALDKFEKTTTGDNNYLHTTTQITDWNSAEANSVEKYVYKTGGDYCTTTDI